MKWLHTSILMLLVSSGSFAMSQEEICNYRARLVEQFALARDAGITERQTLLEAKKQLRKLGPSASDMRSYIHLVYTRRDITPEHFRLATEVSCRLEN